jgi:Cu+-exporting ATPase
MLARIVQAVAEAQRTRASIQNIVDKVSSIFVPTIAAVAIAAFGVWLIVEPEPALSYALVLGVLVLIIACPCALGLPTPVSIMVSMGRGAADGILIRTAEALENMEKVDTLCIDKTRMLTEGKPVLTDIYAAPGFEGNDVLAIVAALEKGSEHPLSSAIITGSKEKAIEISVLSNFESILGHGIQGNVSKKIVIARTQRLLRNFGISLVDHELPYHKTRSS